MPNLPILAVDIDGVISLFGFEETPTGPGFRFELIDGTPHCVSVAAGERLGRLGERFELVWATGWQDRANDHLPTIIGIGPLAVIEFDRPDAKDLAEPGDVRDTAAHWKVAAIDGWAPDRPLAWIDDTFDQSCFDWAARREAGGVPTLLVPTEPELGLVEAHVAVLEIWADGLTAS